MEPVSHIDILLSAQEAMQETYEAELALMEEEGGAYIQAAQFGSEGIGDAAVAIGEKAKELGSAMLKKLEEFIRKVKAFLSNFINSLRQGAIVSTLKSVVAKAEKRLKATDSDWYENAPAPAKVSKWNTEAKSVVSRTYFITETAVNALISGTTKTNKKINDQYSKDNGAIMNARPDEAIDPDLDAVSKAISGSSNSDISGIGAGGGSASAGSATKGATKWLGPLEGFATAFDIASSANNPAIARSAVRTATNIISSMQKDPVLNAYRVVQELEKQVAAARGLAKDAGKDGSKQAKFLKKLQNLVHKSGTTATLMARKQLGSWKTIAALCVRMFSVAGSKEQDDYKED
jgi:hypothetical protein